VNENQRSGVIVSGSSFPKIEKNQIFGNSTSGVILRDNSRVLMKNNKIVSNYYQVSSRNMKQELAHQIEEDNDIQGPNEYVKNCVIF